MAYPMNTQTIYVTAAPTGFQEYHEKYKCCCGCCHITTGAKAVAAVEIALHILALLSCLINYLNKEYDSSMFLTGLIIGVIVTVVTIVCLLFLNRAIATVKVGFAFPLLIFQLILVIIVIVDIGIFVYDLANIVEISTNIANDNHMNYNDVYNTEYTICVIYLTLGVFYFLLYAWFFYIVAKCCMFLRDKAKYFQEHGRTGTAAVVSTVGGVVAQPGYSMAYYPGSNMPPPYQPNNGLQDQPTAWPQQNVPGLEKGYTYT